MTPYRTIWRAPAVFCRWKGVVVYHTYKDDDIEQGPETYYFTTNREGSYDGETDEFYFDVREIATWTEPQHPPYLSPPGEDTHTLDGKLRADWQKVYDDWRAKTDTPANRKAWEVYHAKTVPETIRQAIRAAIDQGLLTQRGYKPPAAAMPVPPPVPGPGA